MRTSWSDQHEQVGAVQLYSCGQQIDSGVKSANAELVTSFRDKPQISEVALVRCQFH